MVVLKGTGEVHDEDGVYTYSADDVFIFPPNVEHKIRNRSTG
jgi:quercetin dioxygenase-like cupin family protein